MTACRDTDAPIVVQSVTRGRCRRVRPIISCRFATATMSVRRGVSKRVDHRLSVADRPLHLSRYGRLIRGPGGRVWPVLTSAETLSAIGIDQDRDGGRGVRLTSDPRRPESAFRSTRFHGAEPGHNSILAAQDALRPSETTKQSSEDTQRKTGRQNPAVSIGRRRRPKRECHSRQSNPCRSSSRPSRLTNVNLDNLRRIGPSVGGV